MKKLAIALGIASVVSAAAPAAAAALPVQAPLLAPGGAPTYNWTGCYIGGNVGGGWVRTSHSQVAKVGGPAIVPPNDFGSSDGSSFIGGGQVGCDYQFAGNWAVGLQGMFDWGKFNSSHVVPTAFPGFPVGSFNAQVQTKNFVTATARLGYLIVPSVLAYVKGGAAWTRQDTSFFGTVPTVFLSESASESRLGWTVGGGLEWMFAPGWSVFGEYNYLDFGTRNISYTAGPGTVGAPDVIATQIRASEAMVGINYKFNWASPVVARY